MLRNRSLPPPLPPRADDLIVHVRRAQVGDRDAADQLVRRFQNFAFACARARLHDPNLAEDAAQDALVEALLCLTTLREPAAFGAYLRRIVIKKADRQLRARRPASSLADAESMPGEATPETLVLARERLSALHDAITALPCLSREVILLFYIGERSLLECAQLLEAPVSTIKSRLHDARRRLKKELSPMIDETLKAELDAEKPSRDHEFAGHVMARLTFAFEAQMQLDPHTADRGLLELARQKLDEAINDPPLTPETVRAARYLLERLRDFASLAELMERYGSQRLPGDEVIWARWWRLWALNALGPSDALFAELPAFVQELNDRLNLGESVRLREWWPFEPAPGGARDIMDDGALRLWALGVSSTTWRQAGRGDEWVALVNQALQSAGATPGNRLKRFHLWRALAEMHFVAENRLDEARAMIARIGSLAGEEVDPTAAERWRLEERITLLHFLAATKQSDAARAVGDETIARLEALTARLAPDEPWWLRTFVHNAACSLAGARVYDLSATLFERVIAANPGSGYAWLRYASVVWATTGDRARTLALLTEASVRDDRSLPDLIRNDPGAAPELLPLLADPEFASALTPKR